MHDTVPVAQRLILVVEDEALLRIDLVDQLEDRGFRVLEAGDADEAMTLLGQHPDIAAVVTDIDMPGSMDGVMLTRLVRDRWPPIELFIVSGKGLSGRDDLPDNVTFLSKPVDSRALFRLLGDADATA